jgi:hypothetical protein
MPVERSQNKAGSKEKAALNNSHQASIRCRIIMHEKNGLIAIIAGLKLEGWAELITQTKM